MINSKEIKNLSNISTKLENNYVIHSNTIIENDYKGNIDTEYKNCIGIHNGLSKNFGYNHTELLNECSSFGKKLFMLYKDNFTLYEPNIIEIENEKIECVSLMKKGFPRIKDNKHSELLSLFIDWFNLYGFFIPPKTVGIEENIILEFKQILILRDKFIILYLIYEFYNSLYFICNKMYNSRNSLSENERYSLNSATRRTNTIGKILLGRFPKLKNDFFKQDYLDKMKYFEKMKKKLTPKINYYSSIFQINVLQHLIYNKSECKVVYISNNLFDLAWNTFLNRFKYSEKNSKVKICIDCGCSYVATGNNSKRCLTCQEEHNATKTSQNEKNRMINYIIEKSANITIKNKDLQNRINEIKSLTEKGNSRKRYTFSKSEIEATKKDLDRELNKIK